VEWTFVTLLLGTVIVFFWMAAIVMLVVTFVDILRRDLSGWVKAGFITLLVLLPFLGVLTYVIASSSLPGPRRPAGREVAPADQIATAARLHESGSITTLEYDILKRQALRR
jgi:hypothetical protein